MKVRNIKSLTGEQTQIYDTGQPRASERITEKELKKAIQQMKIGKAPGKDQIIPETIKFMNDERNA